MEMEKDVIERLESSADADLISGSAKPQSNVSDDGIA